MKKILLSLVFLILLTLSACQQPIQDQPAYVGPEAYRSVIQIDINPSITFIVDENDEVVAVIVNNQEAEIITADLLLLGLNFEDALESFLTAAAETGYLNVTRNDNQVTVSLTSEGKEDLELFRQAIENQVRNFLDRKEIQGRIDSTQAYFDDLKATADFYNVTVSEWLLIQAVLRSDPSLSLEEALALSSEELQTILQNTYQERLEQARMHKEELRVIIQAEIEATLEAIENGDFIPPRSYQELRDFIKDRFRAYQESQNDSE